jgi:hypothetical protein
MNLLFWKKKESTNDDPAFAAYEEIDAKRTSKLGYFFLVLMVIFGVWQGNNFLEAVQESVDRPVVNSTCASRLAEYADIEGYNHVFDSSYYMYDWGYDAHKSPVEGCVFSEREIREGIDAAYERIRPLITKLNALDIEIGQLEQQKYQLESQRERVRDDYQVSVIEDIAATEGQATTDVFDSGELGTGLISNDAQISAVNAYLQNKHSERAALVGEIKSIATVYKNALTRISEQYEQEMRVYELVQFFLSFIFAAPLFYIAWRKYSAARRTRSEYAVIWGGVVATFGIIVAQVLIVFVYRILPHELIQAVFSFLAMFEFIWALLYWFGFILVPLFFGFLIYLIQKRFYNKKAVMMRALKNNHCPHCSLHLTPSMNNCPVCGYTLKTKCQSCGAMSMDGGSFCESCGRRRVETVVPPQST